MTTTDWQPTACILCECNCGIEVQLEGRTLARIRGDKAHPGSQGYTCNKAMRLDHYQNGRHRLTSPLRRRAGRDLRGDRLGHRDRRDRGRLRAHPRRARRRIDLLLRRRRTGQPPRRRLQRRVPQGARRPSYRSSALAQEKTGEAWVDAQLYGGHTRGEFEHAEVSVFVGKNPWMSQSFPRARLVLREIAKDPKRSMIVIDPVVTDTAKLADFHLRVRPGSRRLVPGRAGRHARPGGPRSTTRSSPSTSRGRSRCSPRCARCRSPTTRSAAASTRTLDPRRRAPHRRRRQRRGVRGPRHPAGARTARCAPT